MMTGDGRPEGDEGGAETKDGRPETVPCPLSSVSHPPSPVSMVE